MKSCILIVARDAQARGVLAQWLLGAGYAVELAESPRRAREVMAASDIALAIVAPDGLGPAGLELLRDLTRKTGHVIVVADQAEASGEPPVQRDGRTVTALREPDVLGQVESALGAVPEPTRSQPESLRFDRYILDVGRRTCVDLEGNEVSLTRAEFALLVALARQPGRVLSRDELTRTALDRDLERHDRSIDMLISRLRRKIEADPTRPRIIVTVPGKGYEFTPGPQAAGAWASATTSPSLNAAAIPVRDGRDVKAPEITIAARPPSHRSVGAFRSLQIGAAVAVLAGVTALVIALWHWGSSTGTSDLGVPRQKFDAALIPLVSDSVRKELASYVERPNVKALAISAAPTVGWGIAFGASDPETAKRQALERCSARSAPKVCTIYAVGMDVVWSPASLPLPMAADIHSEPLEVPFDPADVPTLRDAQRQDIAREYVALGGHKGLAIGPQGYIWNGAPDRAQAVRLTIERCGDILQTPCLLVTVDGFLTVQIPRSRPIAGIFMLSTEPSMNEADRQRIAQVYAGKEWRALARGQSGRWYAVDEARTEEVAAEQVMQKCYAVEAGCHLHAIGNWRVKE